MTCSLLPLPRTVRADEGLEVDLRTRVGPSECRPESRRVCCPSCTPVPQAPLTRVSLPGTLMWPLTPSSTWGIARTAPQNGPRLWPVGPGDCKSSCFPMQPGLVPEACPLPNVQPPLWSWEAGRGTLFAE